MRSLIPWCVMAVFCAAACSDDGGTETPGGAAANAGTSGSAGVGPGGAGAAGGVGPGGAGPGGSSPGGAGPGGSSPGGAGPGGSSPGGAGPGGSSPGGTGPGGSGGSSAGSDGTGGSGVDAGPDTGPFPPVTDFQKPGPFGNTTMNNVGPNNSYTVYRPEQLAPNGARNPIVGWMSGGATTHTGYTLLPHLASHGFVVVCSNVVPGIGQEVDLGKQIIAGIDWAIAENGRQGSALFEKLDTTKIASMGYSMGSLATFTIASDPRLTTTVHISGGNMVPERVNNLHAPAAFLCGTPGDASCNILATNCDIAAANCDTDFAGAKTPVFYGNFPGGHLGILTSPNMERIRGATTAWLRWQLMQDRTLVAMFVGAQCTMCSDPNWKVKQKNL